MRQDPEPRTMVKPQASKPTTKATTPTLNAVSAPIRWFNLKAMPTRMPERPRIMSVAEILVGRMWQRNGGADNLSYISTPYETL